MLYIITDNRNILHKKYIFETIFTNFIHLDYQLIIEDAENSLFTIELEDCDTKICFTNIFFNTTDDSFLNKQTLPTQLPNSILCKQYEINSFFNDILTIFYKTEDDFLKKLDNTYYFNFDFFGTIFFYLTRFEEYLIEQKDIHNRVDLVEFYAVRNNIAHRPLVDEYILFFRSFLRKIKPDIVFNDNHQYSFKLSHDLDDPISVIYGYRRKIRKLGADILVRKSFSTFYKRFLSTVYSKIDTKLALDPNNNFDYLINLYEKFNIVAEFNFICVPGDTKMDGNYSIKSSFFKALMVKLHKNGHLIGFHPSYYTMDNLEKTKEEYSILQNVLSDLNIVPVFKSIRHHYLRFSVPNSWKISEKLGIECDQTIGFATLGGFRAGTSHEYYPYDIFEKRKLSIKERPLISMEFFEYTTNRQTNDIVSEMKYYAEICKYYKGNFTFLIHNHNISTPKQKDIFEQIINNCI